MDRPLVSVIIPNWNGQDKIEHCLKTLLAQDYPNLEIIVVDNHSQDQSVAFLKRKFPQVVVLENETNLGFGTAANRGAQKASGKYLLFMNNDTEITKDCLSILVRILEEDASIGIVQPKLLFFDKKTIDSVGCYLTFLGLFWHEGFGEKDVSNSPGLKEVFGATGACFLIPKRLFEQIGGFDENYFLYFEDADLSWQVWSLGYRVVVVNQAVVYHLHGATSKNLPSDFIVFQTFKNNLYLLLKNLDCLLLVFVLPNFLLVGLGASMVFLLRGRFLHFLAVYRAFFAILLSLPQLFQQRKIARARVKIDERKLVKRLTKRVGLKYLLRLVHNYV